MHTNRGLAVCPSPGMVMGKNMVTGASGYVPYSLMEKIEETELPNRRQSRIMGSNFDAMAGQRQRDTARVSRAPSTDRLRFRLEEARSTRGSPAGSSSTSPQMSRGGSADPLPAQMTPGKTILNFFFFARHLVAAYCYCSGLGNLFMWIAESIGIPCLLTPLSWRFHVDIHVNSCLQRAAPCSVGWRWAWLLADHRLDA